MKLIETDTLPSGQCDFYVSIQMPVCDQESTGVVYLFQHAGLSTELELCPDHFRKTVASVNREHALSRQTSRAAREGRFA